MENKVKQIIHKINEQIDIETINHNSHLKNDLGLDSLNLAMLTVEIEDEFDLLGEAPNITQLEDGRKVIK